MSADDRVRPEQELRSRGPAPGPSLTPSPPGASGWKSKDGTLGPKKQNETRRIKPPGHRPGGLGFSQRLAPSPPGVQGPRVPRPPSRPARGFHPETRVQRLPPQERQTDKARGGTSGPARIPQDQVRLPGRPVDPEAPARDGFRAFPPRSAKASEGRDLRADPARPIPRAAGGP